QGGAVSRLAVTGARFAGRLAPIVSGTWRLDVATADGGGARGRGAAAGAACGARLGPGGHRAGARPRHDPPHVAAPAAGDRCAGRPWAVAPPSRELAREPDREGRRRGARVARRERRG